MIIIPNNHRGITEPERESPFVDWLRLKHTEGVCSPRFAAVCSSWQRPACWQAVKRPPIGPSAISFQRSFRTSLMESDQMVIEYGDVLTAGGALAWADLGLRLTERFLGLV